jgi:hypothetical protein
LLWACLDGLGIRNSLEVANCHCGFVQGLWMTASKALACMYQGGKRHVVVAGEIPSAGHHGIKSFSLVIF